jgi:crotonobetainyl-CoA:carnitine CoA-transferase CaiB-like acyl-CoA transferase
MQQIGELFVDAARTGRHHGPSGNRHLTRAPQGCYRCAGANRWAVISVGSDDEWAGLRRAMGDPEWADDERFATAEGRRAAHDELDQRLTGWTSDLDLYEVFHRCQAQGVPAGPVLTEADAFGDPHLRARGFFRENTGADTGVHEYPAHLWHWTGPAMRWEPITGTGYDNEHVWRELAGLSEAEYQKLDADGHLASGYLHPDGTSV